jgi:hypothetical protein
MRYAALFVVSVAGCDARLFTFHVREEAVTTVPAATVLETLIGDFGFGELIAMDVTQSQELQNQGVEPGDIRDVRLESLEIEATAPAGADLSFLTSLDVFVEAPGVSRERMAFIEAFPAGQALVEFEIEDLDLTPYAVSQSMTFDTEVTGSRPEDETEVTIRYDVAIGVTGQGLTSGR